MSHKSLLVTIAAVVSMGLTPGVQTKKAVQVEGAVYKTPTCGCCSKWVDHMRQAGFKLTVTDMPQASLDNVKQKHAVPAATHSCHTAVINGYVVEGHVPAEQVRRLLEQKPRALGIAVPGMPLGSPGMEVSGIKPHPYDVLLIDKQGKTTVFATIKP